MREGLIRLDSELGKKIGLTSANFRSAIIWDCRPKTLYFTLLIPQEPEEPIVRELFRLLETIYTPATFVAPSETVKKIAAEHGYETGVEHCGTPFVTNLRTKKLLKQ